MIAIFIRNTRMTYAALAVITLFVLWVPLSRTIALGNQYRKIQRAVSTANGGAYADGRESIQDNALLRPVDLSERVFEQVAQSCQSHDVKVREITTPKETTVTNVIIQDQRIILEGGFIQTLKSLEDVSDKLYPVKIASVRFERMEVNKKPVLVSQVIFQAVKLSEHE